MKPQLLQHGEVNLINGVTIPEGAKLIEINEDFLIVGESETHGNDHRVAVLDKQKVKFYERDGVLYMQNTEETSIFCPNAEKHSARVVPSGTWRISHSVQVNHETREIFRVAD